MERKHTPLYGIKGKLISAVCMLLVAVIMVVSSTYAWFTLSTAPEVSGISTAIGANGALDIRLNNGTYDPNDDDVNATWGNLVNLSDEKYGLTAGVSLLPSTLYIGEDGKLDGAFLQVPTYRADGRPGDLSEDLVIGTYIDTSNKFIESNATGVRFVGGTTGLSDRQYAFRNALAAASTASSSAKNAAATALRVNGNVLANAVVKKALNGESATFTYSEVNAMRAIVDAFGYDYTVPGDNPATTDTVETDYPVPTTQAGLLDKIEEAYLEQIKGYAASAKITNDNVYQVVAGFDDLTDVVNVAYDQDGKATVTPKEFSVGDTTYSIPTNVPVWTAIEAYYTTRANVSAAHIKIAELEAGANERYSIYTDAAKTDLVRTVASIPDGYTQDAADPSKYVNGEEVIYVTEKTITWADFSAPLHYLIVADNATVNNKNMETLRTDDGKNALISEVVDGKGITVSMPSGAGIFTDVADHCGDYSAVIKADVMYGSMSLKPNVTMKTNNPPTTKAPNYLDRMTTYLKNDAGEPSNAASGEVVISEFYGFILDLEFQTNATDSNLLLQVAPKDRIYSDNNNPETLGGGSYMTFNTTSTNFNLDDVKNLMGFIRIVLFDTATGEILGYAKLDTALATTSADGVKANMYMYKTVYEYTYTVTGDDPATSGTVENEYAVTVYATTSAPQTYTKYYSDKECTEEVAIPTGVTPARAKDGELVKAAEEVVFEKEDAVIAPLAQNTPVKVSTLVYLDGVEIENADVSADAAQSMTGSMNIQFSSSAQLKPMEYGELYTPNQTDAP